MKSITMRSGCLGLAVAAALMAAPPLTPVAGARQGGSSARVRREFRLVPPAGQPLTTTGKARIESRERSRQSVRVEVESRALAAGTPVEAYAFKETRSSSSAPSPCEPTRRGPARCARSWS
jgi:hypothetical protein